MSEIVNYIDILGNIMIVIKVPKEENYGQENCKNCGSLEDEIKKLNLEKDLNEYEQDERKKILYLLVPFIAGVSIIGGMLFSDYDNRIKSIQIRDFNKDKREDVMIEYQHSGKKEIYFQQEDGSYKTLYKTQREEKSRLTKILDKK